MHPHQVQLQRVRRYYQRFKRLNDGIVHTVESENYVDDVYAFFESCYHLKDWVLNDRSFGRYTPQQVEDHVTTSPALAICADICNGSKHLHLKRSPRSGSVPAFGTKVIRVQLEDSMSGEESPTRIAMQFEIDHSGRKLDAFQLASEAMNAWEVFLA